MFSVVRALLVIVLLNAPAAGGGELFRDLALRHGFDLSAVSARATPLSLGPVLQGSGAAPPAWRLAQWGTEFDLAGAPVREEDGRRSLANAGKEVVIHPGGLSGAGVTLTVLGGAEYGGKLRAKGAPWPHLLVEQSFPEALRLAQFERLDFTLDFRVDRCEVASAEPLDPSLHTGQVTAFFSISNANPDSADFGDMIWFGLPVFDARHEFPQGHQAVDGNKEEATGTGKFICTLPGERFYSAPTGDGNWHELRADLVPLVKEALAASQARGFLAETRFADLRPSSFNLGWEVTGPYDCTITLKNLGLAGEELNDEKDEKDEKG